jgi:hypothetical protein
VSETEGRTVLAKRIKELIALSAIGDGMLALIAPSEHAFLWLVGPEWVRKVDLWFAENPTYMRLTGIAQLGFGVWLALRQYKGLENGLEEELGPWYRRWFGE